MNLGVIGAGYVGLTTGICLSSLGHKITIYDLVDEKIKLISEKKLPFYEKDLEELLDKTISSQNLIPTSNIDEMIKNTDGCFICVGTPSQQNNSIDLSQVLSSIKLVCEHLKKLQKNDYVIMIRSTIVPSSTKSHILPMVNQILDNSSYGLCLIPEFLREGEAVSDFMNPDKIVIGSINLKSEVFAKKIFESFNQATILTTNPETAEMIKYANNAFFSMLISFSNEIANIAEKTTGIDTFEVLRALVEDKRITTKIQDQKIKPGLESYLLPGCGFGGSCFPKDVRAILQYASAKNVNTPLLNAVMEINDERPSLIISLAEKLLLSLKNKHVTILGLTFKPDTDDIRSSPAFEAIRLLNDKEAKVFAYDPNLSNDSSKNKFTSFTLCSTLESSIENSDLVILFTKWNEFKNLDQNILDKFMNSPLLIDGRGFLDSSKFDENVYHKIGFTK
ncbi:UDP-glucose 6-dehydrogenase [Nitrosopumilus cobalaminigenes]|uniref:UDP-glucose 6-dehydrogenase n=1 Tax=Nitrosopumilus cobalaminigenes TaxID=1470066 RepID=A0A7D5LYB5_9ARCH|nr:UDP-glucose/GDP-mannose dehydrogenase family protein [Nitrosopumilus cobalaminigenes]QLH02213.1 UDP-glucose 6-dehydrogenase [Nitrosopumilus cobalaminigenes]